MSFPAGWPPRPSSSYRSLRFFAEGTATANFSDRAYLFASGAGANPYTPTPVVRPGDTATVVVPSTPFGGGVMTGEGTLVVPAVWSFVIQLRLISGATRLEYSFDGTNIAGVILATDTSVPLPMQRSEAGIAVRGAGAVFTIEAW